MPHAHGDLFNDPAMQIRCPHCHHPVEVVDEKLFDDVTCPSCGSSISLVSADATIDHTPGGATASPGAAPKRLSHFELLKQVGIGGFGAVWKARDTVLDRIVALKIPRREQLSSSEVEFFLRDARAAAQLRHPNIVSVHEVGRDGETVFIASDFIDGLNLSEWRNDRRLTTREAAELVAEIAEALQHAHERGVVHRDLKPGNILIDTDGKPHITDFGLAKRESGEITMTVDGQILGTPAYMSPEQARGEGHVVDRRADVYSLGVILFELLTGRRPFEGEIGLLLHKVINDDSPAARSVDRTVPRDLDTICSKCLEKQPNKRYQTASKVAEELRRFLAGEPILARRQSKARRIAVRTWNRHRRLSQVAIAALLIVSASGAWAGFRRWNQGELLLKTDGEGLNVLLVGESGDETLHELTLPMTTPLSLPKGDYRVRVNNAGKPRNTYRVLVNRGRVAEYHVVAPVGAEMWRVDTNREERYRVVKVDREPGVLIWSREGVRLATKQGLSWRHVFSNIGTSCDYLGSVDDFDGDGIADFVFAATFPSTGINQRSTNKSRVRVQSGADGHVVLDIDLGLDAGPVDPLFRDIDADGTLDIVVAVNRKITTVSGATGKSLWTADLPDEWANIEGRDAVESLARSSDRQFRPVVQLLESNGTSTVVLAIGQKLIGFNPENGKQMFEPIDCHCAVLSLRPWSDVDGDGTPELLVEGIAETEGLTETEEPFETPHAASRTAWQFSAISIADRQAKWSKQIRCGYGDVLWCAPELIEEGRIDLLVHRQFWTELQLINGQSGETLWKQEGESLPSNFAGRLVVLPDQNGDGYSDVAVTWLKYFREGFQSWSSKTHIDKHEVRFGKHILTSERDIRVAWQLFSGRDGAAIGPHDEMPIGYEGDAWDPAETDWVESASDDRRRLVLEREGSFFAVDLAGRSVEPSDVDARSDVAREAENAANPWPVIRRRDQTLYVSGRRQPEAWGRLGSWWPAADFNGDGVDDLISIPSFAEGEVGFGVAPAAAISGDDGRLLWQTTLEAKRILTDHEQLADLNGDGTEDLVLTTIGRSDSGEWLAPIALCALDGRDGSVLWRRSVPIETPSDARQQKGPTDGVRDIRVVAAFCAARSKAPDIIALLLDIQYEAGNDTKKIMRNLLLLDAAKGRVRSHHTGSVESEGVPQDECEIRLGRSRDGQPIFFVYDRNLTDASVKASPSASSGSKSAWASQVAAQSGPKLTAIDPSNGDVRWHVNALPDHGRASSFNVADLDGDGGDEVVYRTEAPAPLRTTIGVANGETGEVRWTQPADCWAVISNRFLTDKGVWSFSNGFDRAELTPIEWSRPKALALDDGDPDEAKYYDYNYSQLTCYSERKKTPLWTAQLQGVPSTFHQQLIYDTTSGLLALCLGQDADLARVYYVDATTGRVIWQSDMYLGNLIKSSNPAIPPRTAYPLPVGTIAREMATAVPLKPRPSEIARLLATFPTARRWPGYWYAVSPSPEGKHFAAEVFPGWIVIAAPKAEGVTTITAANAVDANAHAPKWSPLSNAVLYTVGHFKDPGSTIWIYDRDTQEKRKLADGNLPTWSQDGKSMYYVNRNHAQQQAEIRSLDLTNPESMPVTLMAGLPWDVVAAVSPDKTHVAYVEYQNDRARLTIVRLGTTTPVFERSYPVVANVTLAWSPDSRRLACSLLYPTESSFNPHSDSGPVWLFDVEPLRVQVLWNGCVNNVSWWPDSKRLLIHVNENQTDEIWLIDPAQRQPMASNPPIR